MEHRRFSQTTASEWPTAFVVSHIMPQCALLTAVKNYNKSIEKLQDFFFKTETKTKTKCSRARPRPHVPRSRPRLSFLSSRRLETKILVSRTTSLLQSNITFHYYAPTLGQGVLGDDARLTSVCLTSDVCLSVVYIGSKLNTLSTEADVHGAQKVLSNNGFRMANCFC